MMFLKAMHNLSKINRSSYDTQLSLPNFMYLNKLETKFIYYA